MGSFMPLSTKDAIALCLSAFYIRKKKLSTFFRPARTPEPLQQSYYPQPELSPTGTSHQKHHPQPELSPNRNFHARAFPQPELRIRSITPSQGFHARLIAATLSEVPHRSDTEIIP